MGEGDAMSRTVHCSVRETVYKRDAGLYGGKPAPRKRMQLAGRAARGRECRVQRRCKNVEKS